MIARNPDERRLYNECLKLERLLVWGARRTWRRVPRKSAREDGETSAPPLGFNLLPARLIAGPARFRQFFRRDCRGGHGFSGYVTKVTSWISPSFVLGKSLIHPLINFSTPLLRRGWSLQAAPTAAAAESPTEAAAPAAGSAADNAVSAPVLDEALPPLGQRTAAAAGNPPEAAPREPEVTSEPEAAEAASRTEAAPEAEEAPAQ